MNIYDFDGDYIAAESEEDAITVMDEMDGTMTDRQCEKLSEAELDRYEFYEEDCVTVKHSFREELQEMIESGEKFPCYFAGEN